MQQVFTTAEFGRFRENSWKREFSEVLVEFVHMMAWEVYSSQKFKLSLCGGICLDGNCTVVSQNVRMLPEQMHSSLARKPCNSLWSSKYGKRLRSAEKYMPYRKSSEKAMYAFYVTGLPLLQLSSLCSYYHAVVD